MDRRNKIILVTIAGVLFSVFVVGVSWLAENGGSFAWQAFWRLSLVSK